MKIVRTLTTCLFFLFALDFAAFSLPLDPNSDTSTYQSNQKDPMHDAFGQGLNPMDMLHKMNLAPGRNADDFNSDSQQGITSAAEQFKKQQKQAIDNHDAVTSTSP
jgi:hypothetical protein